MVKRVCAVVVTTLLLAAFVNAKISYREKPLLEQRLYQPDHLQEYYDLRENCEWKAVQNVTAPTERTGGAKDGKVVDKEAFMADCEAHPIMSCEVEATVAEGKGSYKIIRIGPFSTNGLGAEYMCQFYLFPEFSRPDNQFDWMTRTVSGPVDPYSGLFLGFPPMHIHHAPLGPWEEYSPMYDVPPELTPQLFWYKAPNFGAANSASQCTQPMGGMGCFVKSLPHGYGMKQYHEIDPQMMHVAMHLQDVRDANSPPMLSSMEFGVFHLTEPDESIQEMKTAHDFRMFIGNARDHLYKTSYDSPVYQFGTYYFPTKIDVMSTAFHGHTMEGDEAWIVRGTQEDLGIPEELRREPVFRKSQPSASKQMSQGIPIDPEHDTLDTFKTRMEDALKYAAETRRKELLKHPQGGGKSTKTGGDDTVKPFSTHSPPKSYVVPEILCKYYGTVDAVDQKDLRKDQKAFSDAYANYGWVPKSQRYLRGSSGVEATQYDNTTASVDREVAGFELAGDGEDEQQQQRRLGAGPTGFDYDSWPVSAAEQLDAITTASLPGSYYRSPDSSQDLKEKQSTQCNSYTIEAGEYITIIHFNAQRQKPPAGEFGLDEFVLKQHTIYGGFSHLPDFTDVL